MVADSDYYRNLSAQCVSPAHAYPYHSNYGRLSEGETSQLCQLLEKQRILGLVLVTWGSYALGVFKDDRLVESKTGAGYIHKRHRKGGRDERFGGYRPEQIFFGGNRLILKPLLEECSYLQSQIQRIPKRVLNVRYADREALLSSLEDVNKSLVFSLGPAIAHHHS